MRPHFISAGLFAWARLAAAVPLNEVATALDRPDGLYSVQDHGDGSNTLLEFVPLADLDTTGVSLVEVEAAITARSASTHCEGSLIDRASLVQAWQCLMTATGVEGANVWTWASFYMLS